MNSDSDEEPHAGEQTNEGAQKSILSGKASSIEDLKVTKRASTLKVSHQETSITQRARALTMMFKNK